MMYLLRKRYRRTARLLVTACIATVLMATIEAPSRAGEPPHSRENFIALDSELQAIKAEILEINQEMMLLEESALHAPNEQWIVLVSVEPGSLVIPERITLALDGKTLSEYDYSSSEGAALQAGGVHRLHSGALSAGEHRFDVSWSGNRNRKKKLQQQHSVTINKLPGRKYLEIQLGTGKGKSKPVVSIREWQR